MHPLDSFFRFPAEAGKVGVAAVDSRCATGAVPCRWNTSASAGDDQGMSMNRIVVTSRVGQDGVLHLALPLGTAEANREVHVTVDMSHLLDTNSCVDHLRRGPALHDDVTAPLRKPSPTGWPAPA